MDENKLYIPSGLKLKPELFEGFGKSELFITVIVSVITIIINLALHALHQNAVISIIAILSIISGTVICVIKDQNNLSVVDQLKFMIRFAKLQKKYQYQYYKEYLRY